MTPDEHEDLEFFYYAMLGLNHLKQIPISELEEFDIVMVQRLSKAARHEGIMLLLGVDRSEKALIVETYYPDHQSTPLEPFSEATYSAIYISNEADPEYVIQVLREIATRYYYLDAPTYQKYDHNDDSVEMEEFLLGNARAKYKHDIFMRDHAMHCTLIPNNYKTRP